jgi:hypothetical protein
MARKVRKPAARSKHPAGARRARRQLVLVSTRKGARL